MPGNPVCTSQLPAPTCHTLAFHVSVNSCAAMRAMNTLDAPLASRLARAASTDDLDTSVAMTCGRANQQAVSELSAAVSKLSASCQQAVSMPEAGA